MASPDHSSLLPRVALAQGAAILRDEIDYRIDTSTLSLHEVADQVRTWLRGI